MQVAMINDWRQPRWPRMVPMETRHTGVLRLERYTEQNEHPNGVKVLGVHVIVKPSHNWNSVSGLEPFDFDWPAFESVLP